MTLVLGAGDLPLRLFNDIRFALGVSALTLMTFAISIDTGLIKI